MAKIIHLSNTYIPEDSRILKAIQSGKEDGHEVTGLGLYMPEKQHDIDDDTLQGSVNIALWSMKLTLLPRIVAKGFKLIEMLVRFSLMGIKQRADIIHCHDLPALPAAVFIKLFTPAKIIYDAHELSSQRNGLSRLEQKVFYLAEWLLWPFINALIIVSPSIQDWYAKHLKPKPSEVILNSPHINQNTTTDFNPDYFQKTYELAENTKVFIYLGYLCKGRGLEIFVDAFSRTDIHSHLVIIGYGPLEDTLRKKSAGVHNIHLHDAVMHEDVVKLAKAADYGLCMIEPISLSDEYCLPNKLFEYAFSDLPVIASNLPDIKKLVSDYGLGISIDNNADSLHSLLKDIELGTIDVVNKGEELSDLEYQSQGAKLKNFYRNLL